MFNWITKFNDWAASWFPGLKTQAMGYLTVLLSVGTMFGDYLNTLSTDQWKLLVGEYAPYAGIVIGALVVYFRWLGTRNVDSNS